MRLFLVYVTHFIPFRIVSYAAKTGSRALPKSAGFSLIELLVVLAIVAIIISMGLPEIASYLRNNRLSTQANHFIAVMNFARAQAISRNQEIFVTRLSSNQPYYWDKGWQVWLDGYSGCADPVPNNQQEECEILREFDLEIVTLKGPSNLSSISYANITDVGLKDSTFSFNGGNGSLNISSDMNFYLCHPDGDYKGRHILMRRTGRLRLQNARLYPCPPV